MNDLLDINFNPHGGANGGQARSRSVVTPPSANLDPWGMPAPDISASPQHVAQPKVFLCSQFEVIFGLQHCL